MFKNNDIQAEVTGDGDQADSPVTSVSMTLESSAGATEGPGANGKRVNDIPDNVAFDLGGVTYNTPLNIQPPTNLAYELMSSPVTDFERSPSTCNSSWTCLIDETISDPCTRVDPENSADLLSTTSDHKEQKSGAKINK